MTKKALCSEIHQPTLVCHLSFEADNSRMEPNDQHSEIDRRKDIGSCKVTGCAGRQFCFTPRDSEF